MKKNKFCWIWLIIRVAFCSRLGFLTAKNAKYFFSRKERKGFSRRTQRYYVDNEKNVCKVLFFKYFDLIKYYFFISNTPLPSFSVMLMRNSIVSLNASLYNCSIDFSMPL